MGYFLKMALADTFIYHDNVKINLRSYTRRCYIAGQTVDNPLRLTIPLQGASQHTLIKDVTIDHNQDWQRQHLKSIEHRYGQSSQFDTVYPWLSDAMLRTEPLLSTYNQHLITAVAEYLHIDTTCKLSSDLTRGKLSTDAYHLALIQDAGGKTYLSGLGAKAYQEESLFATAGIGLHYLHSHDIVTKDFGKEVAGLSILHFLFNYPQKELQAFVENAKCG